MSSITNVLGNITSDQGKPNLCDTITAGISPPRFNPKTESILGCSVIIFSHKIVTIVGTHNCVSCRGVRHQGASMITTKANGVFMENGNLARKDFFESIKINNGGHQI